MTDGIFGQDGGDPVMKLISGSQLEGISLSLTLNDRSPTTAMAARGSVVSGREMPLAAPRAARHP
jgi:hypothetical protein